MKRLLTLILSVTLLFPVFDAQSQGRLTGPKVKNQPIPVKKLEIDPPMRAINNGMIVPGVSSFKMRRKVKSKWRTYPRQRITGPRFKNKKVWEKRKIR